MTRSAAWLERPGFVAISSARSRTSNGRPMLRTSEPQLLLLDTHVWLWLVLGSEELGSAARTTIRGAGLGRRSRIAAITVWEIALLASRGRLVLGKRTIIWVEEAVAASTVSILPRAPRSRLKPGDCPGHSMPIRPIGSSSLPRECAGATVLTRDRRILDYAARGHLMAIAA